MEDISTTTQEENSTHGDQNRNGKGGKVSKSRAGVEYNFFKGIARLIFYLVLGLALFFAISLLVFSLRQRNPAKSLMPDLLGKYYIDVHNELARTRLRVKLVSKNFLEMSPGLILYQSIPVGSIIKPREKLYIVINQPEPLLKMPDFLGNSLETAIAALNRMIYKEKVYSLKIGAISHIASESPQGIILAQFPPAEEKISLNDKAYFLISSGPGKASGAIKLELSGGELKKQNIAILMELFRQKQIEYRITEIKPAKKEQEGEVFSIEKNKNNQYSVGVYLTKPLHHFYSGYESTVIELGHKNECFVEVTDAYEKEGKSELEKKRVIFRTNKFTSGEKVKIIFFRTGHADLSVTCDDNLLYNKRFQPDDFS